MLRHFGLRWGSGRFDPLNAVEQVERGLEGEDMSRVESERQGINPSVESINNSIEQIDFMVD